MRFRGTLWLLALACALGALYFFYIAPRASEKRIIEDISSRFFRAESTKVEFLRIKSAQGTYDLSKTDGQWRLRSPRNLPADGKTLETMLKGLREGRISKIITEGAGRLADYGLENPGLVVSIGFAGRIDELAFGSANPSKTGYYAYAKGVQAVFLVDKDLPRVFNVGLHDLRSKEVFSFDPATVTRLLLGGKPGDIEVIKGSEGWRMLRPVRASANGDAVRTFLDGIAGQRAVEIIEDRMPKPGDYSRMKTLFLYTATGAQPPLRLDIHYWGTGAREGVIAFQQGMPYAGRFVREFWDFVGRDASFFRSRNLMLFREDEVGAVRIEHKGERYMLRKKGGDWTMDNRIVPAQRVVKLLWFLKAWTAAEILAERQQPRNMPVSLAVTVEDEKGSTVSAVRIFGTVPGRTPGYTKDGPIEYYYAASRSIEELCIVTGLDLANIPEREEFTQ